MLSFVVAVSRHGQTEMAMVKETIFRFNISFRENMIQ